MKNKYADVTNDEFISELGKQVGLMNAEELLAIPGIYEVLAEHLNNSILESLRPDEAHAH